MPSKYLKDQKLREKTIAELNDRVAELKASMFRQRFERATGKLENYRVLQQTRRKLATVLTILSEKQRVKAEVKK
jgi:large subunit ribosomal protein L29